MKHDQFKFVSPNIQCFTTDDDILADKHKIKYHYTSPDALLSILTQKKIRFTDSRFMNDKSETLYVVKVLLDFIEQYKSKYPYCAEVVNDLLKKNDFEKLQNAQATSVVFTQIKGLPYHRSRKFLFCTCNEADSLNMWNYYVNNGMYQGYNIGFNMEKLLSTFDGEENNKLDAFLVYYGNVLYDEKKQMIEIEAAVRDVESYIHRYMKTEDKPDREKAFAYGQIRLQYYLDTVGTFFKHPKFKSEDEYRIAIEILDERIPHSLEEASKYFGVHNRTMVEEFHTKKGLIVPCLSVHLPENSISRITVSPITEFEIAKSSIKEILDINGFKGVPIWQSTIPIRF